MFDDERVTQALERLHHAAFELRETDPSEAVRLLRRLVKEGGPVEPLAHGALGEILLELFDDVDGATHHFRKLVQLAPELPAGHQGLATALARSGDTAGARSAFRKARAGLEAMLDDARTNPGKEFPAIEEAYFTLLALGDEQRELLGEEPEPVDGRHGDWAETVRLFDGEEDDDHDDWMRYGALRASDEAGRSGVDAGLAVAARLAGLVPLYARQAATLRSHAYESANLFAEAASAAVEGLGDLDGSFDYEDAMRAAALLDKAGEAARAKELLLRVSDRLQRELASLDEDDDEAREALTALSEMTRQFASDTGPKLVGLGKGRLHS